MNILAISGSLRRESSNSRMLRAASHLAPEEMEFISYNGIGGLLHFNPDMDGEDATVPAQIAAWRDAVLGADGVLISSPEYAHGVPGSLKNALDWLVSTPALFEKPALLINAAPAGGMYAQESLAETLRTMGADVLEASLLAPFVQERVRDDTLDRDAADAVRRSLDALASAVVAKEHADGAE